MSVIVASSLVIVGAVSAEPDPALGAVFEIPGEHSTQLRWTNDEPASLLVPYGISREYGSAWASAAVATDHPILLEDLDCGTTYFFYVIVTFESGEVENGPGQEFATLPCQPPPTDPPDVFTVSGPDFAEIRWLTEEPSTGLVVYGPDSTYGLSAGSGGPATSHSVLIEDLGCGELYHFSLIWTDFEGAIRSTSNRPFATDPCAVELDNVKVDTRAESATISWTTDLESDGLLLFGSDSSYGSATESATASTEHSVELVDLECGTEYHFSVVATAPEVESARSSNRQFVTQRCLPKISNPEAWVAGGTMVVTWSTDVATSGELLVGSEGGSWQVVRDDTRRTEHEMVLAGVGCDRSALIRINATGDEGTTSTSLFSETEPCGELDFLSFWFSFDDDSVHVRWNTDRPTDARIVALGEDGDQHQVELPALAHRHEARLTGLECNASYTLFVDGSSSAGDQASRTVAGRTGLC